MSKQTIDELSRLAVQEGIAKTERRFNFSMKMVFKSTELRGKRVLDIGGGSGALCLYAASQGAHSAVCIEPESDGSTSGAAAKLGRLAQKLALTTSVSLEKCRIQEYQPTEKFDVIVANNSVNHIAEQDCINLQRDPTAETRYRDTFKTWYQWCNDDATIVITDCSCKNLFNLLPVRNPVAKTIEWHKHQQPETWARLLVESGFSDPQIAWTSYATLGRTGELLLGNRICSYMLNSHFRLTVKKSSTRALT